MNYKLTIVKFNNGNGTVLCNGCNTMLVDRCLVQDQIDCAHLCEKCWDAITLRNAELEKFVHMIATDYIELSHDKVRWQRDDYIKMAKELRDVEDR